MAAVIPDGTDVHLPYRYAPIMPENPRNRKHPNAGARGWATPRSVRDACVWSCPWIVWVIPFRLKRGTI